MLASSASLTDSSTAWRIEPVFIETPLLLFITATCVGVAALLAFIVGDGGDDK